MKALKLNFLFKLLFLITLPLLLFFVLSLKTPVPALAQTNNCSNPDTGAQWYCSNSKCIGQQFCNYRCGTSGCFYDNNCRYIDGKCGYTAPISGPPSPPITGPAATCTQVTGPGGSGDPSSCGGHASYQCQPSTGLCCDYTFRCVDNDCTAACHDNGIDQTLCTPRCSGGGGVPPPTNLSGGCPICGKDGMSYDPTTKKCLEPKYVDSTDITYYTPVDPTSYNTCAKGETCYPGCGCNTPCNQWDSFKFGNLPCGENGNCQTAIGAITARAEAMIPALFTMLLSLSGLLAVALIIFSGYKLMFSQGNPEKLQGAKEQLTAAIVGLLFVILSFSILRFLGVNLFGIFP